MCFGCVNYGSIFMRSLTPHKVDFSFILFLGKIESPLFAETIGGANHSGVSEFVFLGLSSSWEIQFLLAFFFLCVLHGKPDGKPPHCVFCEC